MQRRDRLGQIGLVTLLRLLTAHRILYQVNPTAVINGADLVWRVDCMQRLNYRVLNRVYRLRIGRLHRTCQRNFSFVCSFSGKQICSVHACELNCIH